MLQNLQWKYNEYNETKSREKRQSSPKSLPHLCSPSPTWQTPRGDKYHLPFGTWRDIAAEGPQDKDTQPAKVKQPRGRDGHHNSESRESDPPALNIYEPNTCGRDGTSYRLLKVKKSPL